jgi:hypothetical protein
MAGSRVTLAVRTGRVSSLPPSREFRDELDDAGREWVRVRIWLERGQVVRFTVQYETTGPDLADDPIPVVRYDTAHGVPHRDRLDRRGREIGNVTCARTGRASDRNSSGTRR